jgi:hypothetical protein
MSVSLSNAFVTLFDAEVKQAYQGKAQLVGAVRARRGVEGSTVKFPKVGRGVATPRIAQTDVTPLNVGFSQVTLTLADWNAAEYSDIFSQAKVNFDERQELVQVVATAMGRRQDQMILDALAASGTSLTVANSIGGAASNMNVAKLRESKRLMDASNVPMDNRHVILHANGLASLLSETAVTSSDFNSVKALVQGEVNTSWASSSTPLATAQRVAWQSTVLATVLASLSTVTPLATAKASVCVPRLTTLQRRPAGWLTKYSVPGQ